ncbi:MAG: hypothetical protein AAF399_28740 [Bacteroidota bacterium]
MKITHLQLLAQELAPLRAFYEGKLGLSVTHSTEQELTFRVGYSALSFVKTEEVATYHYAINIPYSVVDSALSWLQERVKVEPFEGQELVDFPHWQAKAMYFVDPAGNIGELIGRQDISTDVAGAFSPAHYLGISEIGVASRNIPRLSQELTAHFGLARYSGDGQRFQAMGDPQGLFIIVNPDLKTWIPIGLPLSEAPFEVAFQVGSGPIQRMELRG